MLSDQIYTVTNKFIVRLENSIINFHHHFSFLVEKAAFSNYVKAIKESEPVLPEHKIIEVSQL